MARRWTWSRSPSRPAWASTPTSPGTRSTRWSGGWGWSLAGVLAARLFGYRQGVLTMALLAATPQYVAHSMNNPKDLPFATVATASLLAMTWVARTPPFIDLRTGARWPWCSAWG